MTDSLHCHCVGGKLLDKYGTVDPSRVTCPRKEFVYNEVKGISTRPRALTDKTLTNLASV